MGRRLLPTLGLSAGMAMIVACGSYGAERRNDPDAGAALDGAVGVPSEDGAVGAEMMDGGAVECFSWTKDTATDFSFSPSNTNRDTNGLRLTLKANEEAWARRTFASPVEIKATRLIVTGSISINGGPWGSEDGDFVPFAGQYYGAESSQTSAGTTAATLFRVAHGSPNPEIRVLTWHAANAFDGVDRLADVESGNFVVVFDTNWAEDGSIRFVRGSQLSVTVPARTRSGPPSKEFTLVLGGRSEGAVPEVNLVLKETCIQFQ